jgi:uncharacterized delta-60 repeat protein
MATSLRSRAPHLSAEALEPRETPAVVGGLDPSFNGTGISQHATFGTVDVFNAVATEPDGHIIAVWTTNQNGTADFLVVRYNPDGTLDHSFVGGAGRRVIDFSGGNDQAFGVAIQPDGKIVVVGKGTPPGEDFCIARMNADGTEDDSFGTGGQSDINISFGHVDVARAVGFQSDGTIVVAGYSNANSATTGANDMVVIRVRGSGPSAGTQLGTTTFIDFNSGDDQAYALAVYPPGTANADQIVVAGGRFGEEIAKLNTDASLNTQARFDYGTADPGATGVAIQADGKIVVSGTTNYGGTDHFVMLRVNPNLSIDQSFGSFGYAKFVLGGNDQAHGLAVDPFGRFVVAGSSDGNLGVIRVNTDGSPDTSFSAGTGGKLVTSGLQVADAIAGNMVALQSNGRIVAAGELNAGSDGVLARVIGSTELPTRLSVGGAESANANVYIPSGGAYSNPPATVTPAGVFSGYTGEVRVATADVNGDGVPDVVEVTGPGAPTRMAVIDGKTNAVLVPPTDPFGDPNFAAGAYVTAGDIAGTGRADWVITPALTGGPRVVIFQLLANGTFNLNSGSLVANFFGIGDPGFRDGDRVALGDVNGDGVLDVFSIAAFNGGPRTALFDGKDVLIARAVGRDPNKLVNDFYASADGTDAGRGGRSIAVGDFNGDGVADLAVTGDNLLGTGNQVTIFNGADLAAGKVPGFGAGKFISFTASGQPGSALVSLAAVDADGDSLADLVVGSGAGQPGKVRTYLGSTKTATLSGEPTFTDLDPYGAVLGNGVFVG